MKTHPLPNESGQALLEFEIENIYVSVSRVARLLASVPGVTDVKVRQSFARWEEIHVRFRYQGQDCVVWEPFGDNSRYLIGQSEDGEPVDLREIEAAFSRYRPPLLARILGNLLSLRLRSPE